jgi:hypothetical protein
LRTAAWVRKVSRASVSGLQGLGAASRFNSLGYCRSGRRGPAPFHHRDKRHRAHLRSCLLPEGHGGGYLQVGIAEAHRHPAEGPSRAGSRSTRFWCHVSTGVAGGAAAAPTPARTGFDVGGLLGAYSAGGEVGRAFGQIGPRPAQRMSWSLFIPFHRNIAEMGRGGASAAQAFCGSQGSRNKPGSALRVRPR